MNNKIEEMRKFSKDIRIEVLKAFAACGEGHVGGCASIADVIAVLYGGVMNIDAKNPRNPKRDYFVLSKGHNGPTLYAALSLKGFFPKDWMNTLNVGGTNLPSHCDMLKTPGIDMTTGSLGQGISTAVGIALGNRLQGNNSSYVYSIIGDGEFEEGQVYEALASASEFKLDHFFVFLDWNKKQLDNPVSNLYDPELIAKRFEAFGCDTQVVKGYDVEEIYNAIEKAKKVKGKPHAIILDTYKGIGFKFAEPMDYTHYIPVSKEQADEAIAEINRRYENGTYPLGDYYGK